jgi:hypothetical protein
VEAKSTLAEKSTYAAPAELVDFLEARIGVLAAADVAGGPVADIAFFDWFFLEWLGRSSSTS